MTEHELTTVLAGRSFLEAPRWHRGAMWVSDFYAHEVLTIEDGRARVVAHVPGQPSGLGWTAEDDLLVVSMLDRRLLRVGAGDPVEVAALGTIATGPCNDAVSDAIGRTYVGNMGNDGGADSSQVATVMIRVDPDGSTHIVADELRFPNGMALSADGSLLYVAETYGPCITVFDVAADGSLSGRRTLARFSDRILPTAREMLELGVVLPDGIALDADGGVWVADAAGSGAVRVDADGVVSDIVSAAPLTVFGVALGGDDGRTLYLAAAPTLYEHDYASTRDSVLLSCRVQIPAATPPTENRATS